MSRGAAFGDYDNDGKIDIIISKANDAPDLLHNQTDNPNSWVMTKTVGTKSNRSGIGAKVKVSTSQLRQVDEVKSGSSYMSQNDMRLHFGVGVAETFQVEVIWPSGIVDVVRDTAANQLLTVVELKF